MKKIETIWREILYQTLEKKNFQFTQQEIGAKFGFSTSTVFQSLKVPRQMGAVRVTGRFFVLEDPEKLLFYWASVRNLSKDILWETEINLPLQEIENQMPPDIVYGCYTAANRFLNLAPADYAKVYVYTSNLDSVKNRFAGATNKNWPNLTVLKADPWLNKYGQTTSLAQTFVDLWNLGDWQAKEYGKALQEKINGLLP